MKFQLRLLIGLVLLLVGTYYLFNDGPAYSVARSTKELWNFGHIGYFALMVYLLSKFSLLKNVALPYLWLGFILLSLLWGTLIEVLQYGTQRTPDLADISRDLTGCLLVLAFHPALLKLSSRTGQIFVKLLVSIILVIQLRPMAVAVVDEVTAHLQFPVLSSFEAPFELGRWNGGADREVAHLDPESDELQLKISFSTDTFSGVGMKYLPADWRGFKSVNLRIFKPSDKPLSIIIRIHDSEHETGRVAYAYSDRFHSRWNLRQGWNDIAISLSRVELSAYKRKMDLSQIRDISLFTTRLPVPRVIYLDKIFLSD